MVMLVTRRSTQAWVLALGLALAGCAEKPQPVPAAAPAQPTCKECPPEPVAEEQEFDETEARKLHEADRQRRAAREGAVKVAAEEDRGAKRVVDCSGEAATAWLIEDVTEVVVDESANTVAFSREGSHTLNRDDVFSTLPGSTLPEDGECQACDRLLVAIDAIDLGAHDVLDFAGLGARKIVDLRVHGVRVVAVNGTKATRLELSGFPGEPEINVSGLPLDCAVWYRHDGSLLDLDNVQQDQTGWVALGAYAENLITTGTWDSGTWDTGGDKYPVNLGGATGAEVPLIVSHALRDQKPGWNPRTWYRPTMSARFPHKEATWIKPKTMNGLRNCVRQPCQHPTIAWNLSKFHASGDRGGSSSWRNFTPQWSTAGHGHRYSVTAAALGEAFDHDDLCRKLGAYRASLKAGTSPEKQAQAVSDALGCEPTKDSTK